MRININKKIIKQIVAGLLAGTIALSLAGCGKSNSKSKGEVKDEDILSEYSNGYYLEDSDFARLYVIQDENENLRIVNIDGDSVYSSKNFASKTGDNTYEDLYRYMDENIIETKTYTNSDYVNLEKFINGEETYQYLPESTISKSNNLVEPNKWYEYNNRLYCANIQYIEILFNSGKVERICRRIVEDSGSTITGNVLIDIIDGRRIAPTYTPDFYKRETLTANNYYTNKQIECVLLTDLLDNATKDTITDEEIINLYYSIAGKTKEEAKKIINDIFYNNSYTKKLVLKSTE